MYIQLNVDGNNNNDLLNFTFTSKQILIFEACNDVAGPISASFRQGNTAPFEENVATVASR